MIVEVLAAALFIVVVVAVVAVAVIVLIVVDTSVRVCVQACARDVRVQEVQRCRNAREE